MSTNFTKLDNLLTELLSKESQLDLRNGKDVKHTQDAWYMKLIYTTFEDEKQSFSEKRCKSFGSLLSHLVENMLHQNTNSQINDT
jgi:hypothetical protein